MAFRGNLPWKWRYNDPSAAAAADPSPLYLGINPMYITPLFMLKVLGRTHTRGRQSGRTWLMAPAFNPMRVPRPG